MLQCAEIMKGVWLGVKPRKEDIIELKKKGITAILSLLEDHEGALEIKDWAEANDLVWAQVPIPDAYYDGVPQPEQIIQATEQLADWLSESHRIYLHCFLAKGRSPLIVIAYLCLKKKIRLCQAIFEIKHLWPPTDPNAKQIRVLCELLER